MEKTFKILFGCACLMLAFNIPSAHAQVVDYSGRSAFDTAFPGANLENWSEYNNGTVISNGQTLNGITYNTNTSGTVVTNTWASTNSNGFGLGDVSETYFLTSDTETFTFSKPLSAFAIDINTFSSNTGAYEATLSNGAIIDSISDPFPGYTTGESIDFSDSNSFTSITISDPNGDAYNLDSLQYSYAQPASSVVPEPSSIYLMMLGLVAMIAVTTRRKLGIVK